MRTSLFLFCLAIAPAAVAQEHQHGSDLGTVNFANSCSAAAQPAFTHAMAQLHSFEFVPARAAFNEALQADPGCAIASWGVALTNWANPFAAGIKPPSQVAAGKAAIDRAVALGAKSERERAYISAAASLFADGVDQRARVIAYRDAMLKVAQAYPDDPEASTFYALSLAAAADPADKTYADQLKAGAILEKLWVQQPMHPGLAHYIIHAYDVPALAPQAIEAARKYGKIAPAAPHALHMPSHTFTRLGYWQESIDTNILSAAAAHKSGNRGEELHASDYEVYAYLQTAQDSKAKQIVEALPTLAGGFDPTVPGSAASGSAGSFAIAAIPARYALERGAWREAAALEVHPTAAPYTDAMTWFARAVGAARSKDAALLAEGQKAVEQLQSLSAALAQANEPYWAEQVAIQRLGASAWLALAQGKSDEALALMREAAVREDKTEKSAVTPGPLAPAHEMLGEMLLELKQPGAAMEEFRKTMAKEPNRFRALAGAAAAATGLKDTAAARGYDAQLLKICERADQPGRPELVAARQSLQR